MTKPYKYRLRPSFESDNLLLEFHLAHTDSEFGIALFSAIKDIHPVVDTIDDFWMNDEVLVRISSDKGAFILSKDTWGSAFIMADNNQTCIKLIDEMLRTNHQFEKEVV